jgi:hypothetical protein
MRVQSDRPCESGGWFHDYAGAPRRPVVARPIATPAKIDAASLIDQWRKSTALFQIRALAGALNVLTESLVALGACWAPGHAAWAFPMRDGFGEIVGVRLRGLDGRKWAVTGSKQGLFVPQIPLNGMVFLPEGPTSTAALLSLGFYAIGRPSCNCSADPVEQTLKRIGAKSVVIVSDKDEPNEKTGESPGLVGAMKLKDELKIKSCIWTPPTKDIRDFLRSGGMRDEIKSAVNQLLWKKK